MTVAVSPTGMVVPMPHDASRRRHPNAPCTLQRSRRQTQKEVGIAQVWMLGPAEGH